MKIYQLLDVIENNDMDLEGDIKFINKFDPKDPEMVDVIPMVQFNTITNKKNLLLVRSTEIPKISQYILHKLNSGPVS